MSSLILTEVTIAAGGMENPDVQQALIDTLKNLSETEEMSGTDRKIYILKLSLRYLEDELAQVRKRLAEIEEE